MKIFRNDELETICTTNYPFNYIGPDGMWFVHNLILRRMKVTALKSAEPIGDCKNYSDEGNEKCAGEFLPRIILPTNKFVEGPSLFRI